ncbi:alpha/beta-hydrolase [Lentinus tigrinus ALCF2SS1-7]|uniref:Carboxypeptidase n=1 Tax=Lentinus tigrinus ALCF2SS1-6 TaxID=1328759 RepID=A0A5C2S9T8_9APHY|nr:alpha/beta-hydrolase [Lentinus tigrinus ALCF2SS1-6]RPD75835.1 alpha/beta-hydrolase [Lentinus tigrinus ALCF2SS1-7]
MFLRTLLSIVSLVLVGVQANSPAELRTRKAQIAAQFPVNRPRPLSGEGTGAKIQKNITFKNPRASEFWVNGSTIPDVDWDIGDSWAGLLPISNNTNETRKLFFWFFPPGPQGSFDDLIFWTNGGPGCSSLEGLSQENGPFQWAWGTAHPTQNEYSWTNLSSVLYLEQPIGTGFSQGEPTAENEDDIAEQIVGFMKQFLEIFSELEGKKLYLSGESYAGMYVPYLANYIYENPDELALELQGIFIADPVLGWYVAQQQIPAVAFVHKYDPVFSLNRTFMAQIDAVAARCGYANYVNTYMTYPPKGPLPLPGNSTEYDEGCNVWEMILNASVLVNPGFNYYRIFDNWPILWDILGYPAGDTFRPQSPIYFNRTDVKKAIHAPEDANWGACSDSPVFPNGDSSLPPAFTVLPNVIEKSARTVIAHGLADYDLIAEGARIVLQNMTWGGLQGFQTPIQADSFLVDGIGALGTVHEERGLTYYEVSLSGHMIPQFSPWSAYQMMQYLMGFRDAP